MDAATANVRTAMAESSASSSQPRSNSAPSYLVAGVLFYGAVGWLLDQWLGTRFLVAVGVLLGAGRFRAVACLGHAHASSLSDGCRGEFSRCT